LCGMTRSRVCDRRIIADLVDTEWASATLSADAAVERGRRRKMAQETRALWSLAHESSEIAHHDCEDTRRCGCCRRSGSNFRPSLLQASRSPRKVAGAIRSHASVSINAGSWRVLRTCTGKARRRTVQGSSRYLPAWAGVETRTLMSKPVFPYW